MSQTVKALLATARKEKKRLLEEIEERRENLKTADKVIFSAQKLLEKAKAEKKTTKKKKTKRNGRATGLTGVAVDFIRADKKLTRGELLQQLKTFFKEGFSEDSLDRGLRDWVKEMGGVKVEGRGDERVYKTAKKKNLKSWA